MGKKTFNATLLAVIVFAAMMTAFACRNRNESGYVPDPGCSPVVGGQVCPLPSASSTSSASHTPSPIKAKAADVPEESETNAAEPKPTYVAPVINEPDPQNPTAGGGTGGYAQPQPTVGAGGINKPRPTP